MSPESHSVASQDPVSGGKGYIFGSPIEDLSEHGFTMEEYFLEGIAVSYAPAAGTELGLDGLWDVEPADEASYKTRAYVVRPVDPAKFNGVVLVNWRTCPSVPTSGCQMSEQLRTGLRLGRDHHAGRCPRGTAVTGRGHAGNDWSVRVGPGALRLTAPPR